MHTNHQPKGIQISKYILNSFEKIGRGSYGNVYKGINIQTKQPVAIKVINMGQINNQVLSYLHNGQIKAHQKIKNQYIIKTHEVLKTKDHCYIVMELCSGGNLKQYINKKGRLSCQQALQIFRKILLGYISIIQAQFLHRDIKSQNVLLRNNGDPVIIDFGFCQNIVVGPRPALTYNVGTPQYMAPQALLYNKCDQKNDIWGLGVVLYQMITGKTFQTSMQMEEIFKIMLAQRRVRIDLSTSNPKCRQILQNCFQINPQKRPSAYELLKLIDKPMQSLMKLNSLQPNLLGQQLRFKKSKSSCDLQTTIDTQGAKVFQNISLKHIMSQRQRKPVHPVVSVQLFNSTFSSNLQKNIINKPQSATIHQNFTNVNPNNLIPHMKNCQHIPSGHVNKQFTSTTLLPLPQTAATHRNKNNFTNLIRVQNRMRPKRI